MEIYMDLSLAAASCTQEPPAVLKQEKPSPRRITMLQTEAKSGRCLTAPPPPPNWHAVALCAPTGPPQVRAGLGTSAELQRAPAPSASDHAVPNRPVRGSPLLEQGDPHLHGRRLTSPLSSGGKNGWFECGNMKGTGFECQALNCCLASKAESPWMRSVNLFGGSLQKGHTCFQRCIIKFTLKGVVFHYNWIRVTPYWKAYKGAAMVWEKTMAITATVHPIVWLQLKERCTMGLSYVRSIQVTPKTASFTLFRAVPKLIQVAVPLSMQTLPTNTSSDYHHGHNQSLY